MATTRVPLELRHVCETEWILFPNGSPNTSFSQARQGSDGVFSYLQEIPVEQHVLGSVRASLQRLLFRVTAAWPGPCSRSELASGARGQELLEQQLDRNYQESRTGLCIGCSGTTAPERRVTSTVSTVSCLLPPLLCGFSRDSRGLFHPDPIHHSISSDTFSAHDTKHSP